MHELPGYLKRCAISWISGMLDVTIHSQAERLPVEHIFNLWNLIEENKIVLA